MLYRILGLPWMIFDKRSLIEQISFAFLIVLVNFLLIIPVSGQNLRQHQLTRSPHEAGTPFIQLFGADDYQASVQNWDILEDSLGLVYIANGRGLLIYNGESFELLKMPGANSVRCLAIDHQNRIYCGGAGYFGYLTYEVDGSPILVNLADSISESGISFSTVEDIFATEDGIFFRSPELMLRWDGHSFVFWEAVENHFLATFLVNGQIRTNRRNLGMQLLNDDNEFKQWITDPILDGEKITSLMPFGEEFLLGTDHTLFEWNGNKLIPFQSASTNFIKAARLFKGSQLSDGSYALCTLNEGLIIMDKEGQVLININANTGLASNSIHQIYQSNHGQLWIATNNGIAMVEYPSAFTSFTTGRISAPISAILRFEDDLLVGTLHGLFRVEKTEYPPARLSPFLNITDRIWDLLVVNNELFIGFEDGLYLYDSDKKIKKIAADATSKMWRSVLDTNRIFVASRKGLYSLYLSQKEWKTELSDIAISESVYYIKEQKDGTLWLDMNKTWIYQISFPSREDAISLRNAVINKFDTNAGLPDVKGYMMMHDDRIYYIDNASLNMLRYDPEQNRFNRISPHQVPFPSESKQQVIALDDVHQNKWVVEFNGAKIDRTFLVESGIKAGINLQEDRIYDLIGRCMFYDGDVIWHGGKESLIRYDLKKQTDPIPFNTIIDKVLYREDSLVSASPYRSDICKFPFAQNSFRFTYGNSAHFANQKTEYQYYLEGLMDDWSTWSSETKRDFTNLKEGNYKFKVCARIMNGHSGSTDEFEFTVLPPWHRSWWAYIMYTILGILGTGGMVRWRSRQLQKEKIELQNVIQLHTAELQIRNEQLEEKKKQLSEQTLALKAMDEFKSQLFANISHEFRTPLTLITGPLNRLKKFPDSQLTAAHVEMMDRNANRLLRLVNQIMDLSKLDARDLPLNLIEGNVFKSIRAAASSFSSHAAEREVDYQIIVPANQLWAAFDRDKLEKVIYNLLSNAFKFTDDSGTIKLQASYLDGALMLEISDTGRGISSAELPKIFDRFYQGDNSDAKTGEGSGVGLALVKELVHLMSGTIHVNSTLDRGSTFFVELPLESLSFVTDGRSSATRIPVLAESKFPPADVKEKAISASDSPLVLIIEDNPDMRSYIIEHLEKKYQLLEASNAKDGLKMAITKMPDLIITDLMMPKMDGLEFCAMVRTDFRISHIPVIILTAKAGLENRIDGLESGADVYLTKPFNAEELLVQINRLIENRAVLRTLFSQQQGVNPKDLQLPHLDQQFIEQVLAILEDKYGDPGFDVPRMHQLLAMSRTQLHRKMKAFTGLAPGAFIRHFRLKRAAQILAQGESVAQTAYSVGFNNLSYFARSFRALFGVSPKDYAKQNGDS